MMIPTHPEVEEGSMDDLDPVMWAVWKIDDSGENIEIVRIVPDQATAEGIDRALAQVWTPQSGYFKGKASSLFATVREQGRLAGQAEMMGLMNIIRDEIQEVRKALDELNPRGKAAQVDFLDTCLLPNAGPDLKQIEKMVNTPKPWWEVTSNGR